MEYVLKVLVLVMFMASVGFYLFYRRSKLSSSKAFHKTFDKHRPGAWVEEKEWR